MIVDDEPPAQKVIKNYVELVPELSLAGTCSNALQALEILKNEKIDLLFLDIQMPKLTGIGFLKTLTYAPKVIFTTAYREFAADAFDLDAVDYLLKPISLERFLKAINKLTKSETVISDVSKSSNQGFLYFRANRKMIKVFLDEINYIESLKDYIKIYLVDNTSLVVKQSLSTVEAMLPKDLFTRIHRSFIVSLNKITAFTHHDVEIGEIEIPIGRNYHNKLKKINSDS